MIRFIDLTGQVFPDDNDLEFAWYDTATDTFLSFNYCQTFSSWKEFVGMYECDNSSRYPLKRFENLFPRRY